jgi:hypothetical protein
VRKGRDDEMRGAVSSSGLNRLCRLRVKAVKLIQRFFLLSNWRVVAY